MMSNAIPTLKGMCCLSNDIYEYHYVSQGKTTIPNVDDAEEMLATDVRASQVSFTQQNSKIHPRLRRL